MVISMATTRDTTMGTATNTVTTMDTKQATITEGNMGMDMDTDIMDTDIMDTDTDTANVSRWYFFVIVFRCLL